ncbi:bifunctional protein GlmU [Amylibacter ulvae]|uniref:Bifunctional protein GlmU n=1 Tax=Paramylibacter ulvae TaxID=1651968 RepID=A0ABQ3D2J7_9RHOB|nr:bifunctional UDP-N-acetylglucosamine diphosphorylase/glucosamine-1-phosphate N-acetyltransferase GlmU [Amylibacter ulvae]GHA53360.1 bifunctional protein GlmU [Amylibacter ulvae]
MSNAVIILAAGKGTRMQSDLPKVLHAVASAPMLVHTMRSGEGIDAERTIVVAGHGADLVEKAALDYNSDAQVVLQTEQLGTGHAVEQARAALSDFDGDVFILYGDTPFITHETLQSMKDKRDSGASVVVLGFTAANAGGYGRLILADDGSLDAIVEAKDATPEQLMVNFCNSGVICAPRDVLFDLIAKVGNDNANGEYYLTDIVALARDAGMTCAAVSCDESETMGVNSRVDLAVAESTFQFNARHAAMINGATLTAPETVFFAYDTIIGRDVIVEPNVVFGPDVTIESGANIRAFSHLEGCHVSKDAIIGPYARLRPGAEIGDGAKVGNFVEVKNALVAEGAKLNHLSYIGDAEVGKDANIGAGTITCNYDGVFKHKTIIGERAFIGSNSALVAPVRIGDDAMTGSGSVITLDVPDGDLALGRAKQVNKVGFALRLMNKLKAAKAAKKKD